MSWVFWVLAASYVVHLARSDNLPDPNWQPWKGLTLPTVEGRLESRMPADNLEKIKTTLKITLCKQELINEAVAFLVNRRFHLRVAL